MANMKGNLKKPIQILGIVTFAGVLFLSSAVVNAIARGYSSTDTGLQSGMAVILSSDSSETSQVERATQESAQRVIGIVTTIDNSLVTVTSNNTKVLVENEGEVDAYITDMNGEVKRGDALILSPLKGVLMKAGTSGNSVIAISSTDFSSVQADPYPIEGSPTTKDVKIAKLRVNLNHQAVNDTEKADSTLSNLGRSVVGREISEIRILVALVIFFLILIAEASILYGGISSAIAALGRNPLARKIIRQELVRVIAIALIVLLIGLGAVYAILAV